MRVRNFKFQILLIMAVLFLLGFHAKAYAKEEILNIDKFVNGPDLDHYTNYEVNEAKNRPVSGRERFGFSLVSYLPKEMRDKVGEEYYVKDYLHSDFNFYRETLKAYVIPAVDSHFNKGILLEENIHYDVDYDEEKEKLKVTLTDRGKEIDGTFLLIKYECSLKDSAKNGINLYSGADVTYVSNKREIRESKVEIEPEVHEGQISVLKLDAGNPDKPLEGAKFGISASFSDAKDGEYLQTAVTDNKGMVIFKGLKYGDVGDKAEENSVGTRFWISEIEAPKGYQVLSEPKEVEFKYQTGEESEMYFARINVYNEPIEKSILGTGKGNAKTGDGAPLWMIAVLMIVSIICSVMVVIKKRN